MVPLQTPSLDLPLISRDTRLGRLRQVLLSAKETELTSLVSAVTAALELDLLGEGGGCNAGVAVFREHEVHLAGFESVTGF